MAKKKTNKFLWIVLIAVVVVALVGAYFYYNGMGSYTRNGGRFTADSGSSLNVQIKDYYFTSGELTIKVGDTVTWTNYDLQRHNVVSVLGDELNSGMLYKGNKYYHTFTNAGTYDYYCTIHPSMKGKIIVR